MNKVGEGQCGECGQECEVIAHEIAWDYAGTHCTHGLPGTHYEGTDYLSDCCEEKVFSDEGLKVEFDEDDIGLLII